MIGNEGRRGGSIGWIGMAVLCMGSIAMAQTQMLTTTFASNNGQNGNMFDLEVTGSSDVTIVGWDINTDPGTDTVETWEHTGTYVGTETTQSAWALHETVAGVVSAGTNNPTPVSMTMNVPIPAGQRHAFYVTCTTRTGINYTNGTSLGAPYASDANLTFYQGVGKSYPFGGTFRPRIWNGNIYYTLGGAGPGPAVPAASPGGLAVTALMILFAITILGIRQRP